MKKLCLLLAIVSLLSCEPCDYDISADGDAYEQVDYKADKRRVAAYGGHGVFANELTNNSNVGCVEQLLEHAGRGKRQCKKKDLVPQRSVQHIYRAFFACHDWSSFLVDGSCRLHEKSCRLQRYTRLPKKSIHFLMILGREF